MWSMTAWRTLIGPSRSRSGVGLEGGADAGERVERAVADRDDEVVADEDHDLAGLDVRRRVDVAQRLEDDEEGVVVALDLGPLPAGEDVLDGERVELELLVDHVELGLVRVVEADPEEVVGPPVDRSAVEGVAEVEAAATLAVVVARLVHDHGAIAPHRRPPPTICAWPSASSSRHGHSTANAAGILSGRAGRRHPHRARPGPRSTRSARPSPTLPLAGVRTSPLERCRETADALARSGIRPRSR